MQRPDRLVLFLLGLITLGRSGFAQEDFESSFDSLKSMADSGVVEKTLGKPNAKTELLDQAAWTYQRKGRTFVVLLAEQKVSAKYSKDELTQTTKSLARQCAQLMGSAQWETLESEARKWALLEPDNARPWLYAASAAQNRKDRKLEFEYLKAMPKSAPPAARLRLSHLYFLKNEIRPATAILAELIKRDPSYLEAHNRLIFIYAMTRQRDLLIKETRRAIQDEATVPHSFIYLIGADWITFTNGYQVNSKWAQQHPDDNEQFEVAAFGHLISTGVKESDQNTQDEKEFQHKTENLLLKLRKKYPGNEEILIWEMKYLVHQEKVKDVETLLAKNQVNLEQDSRYWAVQGWLQAQNERWSAAEKSYLKCLSLNAFDWQAREQYAEVLGQLGKPNEKLIVQKTASLGKEVMKDILQSNDTTSFSRTLLRKIAEYAKLCDEKDVAQKLLDQLGE